MGKQADAVRAKMRELIADLERLERPAGFAGTTVIASELRAVIQKHREASDGR